MAFVRVSMDFPPQSDQTISQVMSDATNILTTGDKCAMIGRYWNKDGVSKNIQKIGWLPGTLVKAGSSGLTMSLQDVDLTAGPPWRPDGTQDQTVAVPMTGLTQFTWNTTANLSATRTIVPGELLAVVLEFDGGGRLGSDAFRFSSQAAINTASLESGIVHQLTGTWTAETLLPNVCFTHDDATVGTLTPGIAFSSVSSDTWNSGTNPEVRGLEFTPPFACYCDGAWMHESPAAGADHVVELYDGDVVMASGAAACTTDSNAIRANGIGFQLQRARWPEVQLTAGHTYRIGKRPTTANSVLMPWFTVAVAANMDAIPGGQAFLYNTFHAASSPKWSASPTTTKRFMMGAHLSQIDDGTGSGGGGGMIKTRQQLGY